MKSTFHFANRIFAAAVAPRTALALAVTLLSSAGRADGEPPSPPSELARWVGDWSGAGSLRAGKDTAPLSATWTCRETSAAFGVSCGLRVTGIPGLAVYEETDLFGYDPSSRTYHWYSVTNAGETHDHVASPPGAAPLVFTYRGTRGAAPLEERIELRFSNAGQQVVGRAETRVGGALESVMELSLGKRGA